MTIIDKIKQSVEVATGLPFFYDTAQTLNTRLSMEIPLPCAMLHIVEGGAVIDDNGVIRERLSVQVLFCDVCDFDFDGVDTEAEKLDALKRVAFKWLLFLHRSTTLRLRAITGTRRYYADTDAILCAFGVSVEIEEIDGIKNCDGVKKIKDV